MACALGATRDNALVHAMAHARLHAKITALLASANEGEWMGHADGHRKRAESVLRETSLGGDGSGHR